jgi:hypothetical protein
MKLKKQINKKEPKKDSIQIGLNCQTRNQGNETEITS